MAILFTSDLHFGHEHIIKDARTQFHSLEEMENALIKNWNKKVKDDDEVYILGDLAFRTNRNMISFLHGLKGKKHLVIGNHDKSWLNEDVYHSECFESISHMLVDVKYDNKYLTMCHYPMLEWSKSRYPERWESYLLHGHIHNRRNLDSFRYIKANLPRALNVGVDINNYEPVTFEELLENNKRWYQR